MATGFECTYTTCTFIGRIYSHIIICMWQLSVCDGEYFNIKQIEEEQQEEAQGIETNPRPLKRPKDVA